MVIKLMNEVNELLCILLSKKGEYVSGEELSEKFGVTRTSIWKKINNLREMGYEIESSTRLGYRILKSPDLLLPEEIKANSKPSFLANEIYYFTTTESTNDIAKKLANEGAGHGTLVLAEEQLGGKGRLGRKWVSPKGKGIWLSIILRPEILPKDASKLTLLTAVAATDAIIEKTGLAATIKWPNDILINDKKVSGVLTEMNGEMDLINYVVVGIGINVNNESFPGEIAKKATSLKIQKKEQVSRLDVLTCFLEIFEKYYDIAIKNGFEEILLRWKKLCCNLNKQVIIYSRKENFKGIAVDIDDDGALIVKKKDGEIVKVLSGDVSLR